MKPVTSSGLYFTRADGARRVPRLCPDIKAPPGRRPADLRTEGMRSALRFLPLLALALAGCDFTYDLFADHEAPAKEAVLRTNLRTLRDVLSQYSRDKGRRPESLQALVEAGYLRKVPVDPFTRSSDTWISVYAPPEAGNSRQIVDVRSGAAGRGKDGRLYRNW